MNQTRKPHVTITLNPDKDLVVSYTKDELIDILDAIKRFKYLNIGCASKPQLFKLIFDLDLGNDFSSRVKLANSFIDHYLNDKIVELLVDKAEVTFSSYIPFSHDLSYIVSTVKLHFEACNWLISQLEYDINYPFEASH